MRKVFKPDKIIKNNKIVRIPDVEFKPEPKDSDGEPVILTDEVYREIEEKMRDKLAGELGRQKLSAAHERDLILSKAKSEAQHIIDDAKVSRRHILEEADSSAVDIKSKAYQDGLKKGIEDKTEQLESLAGYISQNIEQLKNAQDEYFREYEKQIKYIAVEIAEKIIYQKIQEDDMAMYSLVKNAVKSVRDSSWIKAEVSEKLNGYADSLEKELADFGIKAEISVSADVPDDTCVLNTSEGIVVATVSQQLENLKEFISRQDRGGNDEELS